MVVVAASALDPGQLMGQLIEAVAFFAPSLP
jgi:hypothetical protein